MLHRRQLGLRIVREKSENMPKILWHRGGIQNFRYSGRRVDYVLLGDVYYLLIFSLN